MKTELKTYIVVDYNDLDKAISETYDFKPKVMPSGRSYGYGFECVAAEEMNNYSNYIIDVDGENDKWGQEIVDKRKSSFGSVRAYLNDMAKRDLVPKGVYLVKVFW